ncbi:SOS response-associated peptidase [Polycladidibacter hongkongensis]|uniref:SOS response-associated peptidase n=1 Tax=Polycladidibacter hongkongensis TaxID=1647556 RepID=UPI00082CFB96|nr:SOS response-associated peptidase [Pseudovibrio hongkongensis]
MCGRFALTATPEQVRTLFQYLEEPSFPARYNIAPTQPIALVTGVHGQPKFMLARWGLVPAWVKDPASFSLLINARAETLLEKPSFKNAAKHRRCLIPASCYYEWQRKGKEKQPYMLRPPAAGTLAFAGIWETYSHPEGGDIDTAAIITIPANRFTKAIHDRMPATIAPQDFSNWLDTDNVRARHAMPLLYNNADQPFEALPISSSINAASYDRAELQDAINLAKEPEDEPHGQNKASARKADASSKASKNENQLDLFQVNMSQRSPRAG